MASLSEFVSTVVDALNASGFPYVITGSFASIYYSEPRTTMDIDVVVNAPFDALEQFRDLMVGRGWYAPSIDDATDMFNVVDPNSGWKADIIRWQDEPFDRERFARRTMVELLPGLDAYIPTVEDMILAKLRWIEGRESAMQLRDVESMIEVNGLSLDRAYLRLWAARLGVEARLEHLLGSSDS